MGPIIPVPCTYFLKALQEELKEKLGALESPGPCVSVFLATVPTVQRGDGAPCPPAQPSPASNTAMPLPCHAHPVHFWGSVSLSWDWKRLSGYSETTRKHPGAVARGILNILASTVL